MLRLCQNKKLVSFFGNQLKSQKNRIISEKYCCKPATNLTSSQLLFQKFSVQQQLQQNIISQVSNDLEKQSEQTIYYPTSAVLNAQELVILKNDQKSDENSNDSKLPPQDNNNNSNEQNNDNNNDNNNDENNNNLYTNLKAVPLRNYKAELTPEEQKLETRQHILFSSQQPIIPYTSVPCQLRTGNLNEIEYPLAYFLLNDDGDVYLIGQELENKVGNNLKKNFQNTNSNEDEALLEEANKKNAANNEQIFGSDNTGQSLNMQITPKKMSSRVKIVEIKIQDSGIFAVTIPYKDHKPTFQQEQFNLEPEFDLIKNSVKNIKKSVSYEKIEIFQDFDIEKMNFREFSIEQVDQIIFQIIQHIQKLYARYMKENINLLIQSLIESRSIVSRVQLLRHHIESLEDVLEIVNTNFKVADENLIRMHTQARARMSMEYIKQAYFGGSKDQPSPMSSSTAGAGQQGASQFGGAQQSHQGLVRKYQEKLSLIEDEPSREKISKEIARFAMLDKNSSEYNKVHTYLDEVFSIPWKKYSEPFWDINYAKEQLDNQLYGLEKVKQRIIEMIAINQLKNTSSKKSKGFIILLNGPPGIGKTSIAKAVASSLKREHRFISFAGVSDPYFIKGHRRTYVDSQPGVFVKELIKASTMNPVFILDEIDKVSRNSMGADPYYSLLEILNPDENNNFVDHYMDIKTDFSNVIFILTANEILHMLEPLRNRLELIELPAYIEEEKLQICKNFLIPKVFDNSGVNPKLINFNDQTLSTMINNWCYHESGVRELKRQFETICRKFAVELIVKHPELIQKTSPVLEEIEVEAQQNEQQQQESNNNKQNNDNKSDEQEIESFVSDLQKATKKNNLNKQQQQSNNSEQQDQQQNINNQEKQQQQLEQNEDEINYQQILSDEKIQQLQIQPLDLTGKDHFQAIKKYLGSPSSDVELEKRSSRSFPPGTVNILTVAGFVGHALTVECVYDHTQIDKKGIFSSSGNLKTVLKESLLIAKINAYKYMSQEQINKANSSNFHIHFMQGAIAKDGPSAGTAITTALLSLVLDKQVPSNVAMTGEISLNGEVCKIGGLQSKIIGSKTVEISRILVPYANMNECLDFPQKLLDGITIHFVKEYSQIFEILFNDRDGELVPGVITIKDGKLVSPTMVTQQTLTPNTAQQTINNTI